MLFDIHKQSFSSIFEKYRQEHEEESTFETCVTLWKTYDLVDPSITLEDRLVILYLLYAYYRQDNVTCNPFLCFFLECLNGQQRAGWLERWFVNALLNGSILKCEQEPPSEVADEPNKHLAANGFLTIESVTELHRAVAQLLDPEETVQPWPTIDNISVQDEIKTSIAKIPSSKMQDHVEAIAYLASLLQDATTRTLTIREIKILTQVSKDLPLLLYQLPLQLEQIHLLVDRNQMLAMEVVPVLLMGPLAERYWDALVQHTVSTNTLEVIHHCLITRSVPVQRELIHLTVDLAIITCTEADYTHEEKYVRTFLKFIQSLHDHQLVDYANHVPGLQSFCIQFLHIRGVSALYKTISNIQVQE